MNQKCNAKTWFRFCEILRLWLIGYLFIYFFSPPCWMSRVSSSKPQPSSDKAEINWDLTDTTTSTPSNNDTINWNISLGTAKLVANLIFFHSFFSQLIDYFLNEFFFLNWYFKPDFSSFFHIDNWYFSILFFPAIIFFP